jgi:hypothetical protein
MGVYCILNDIRNLKVRLALKTANKIQKSLLYYEDNIHWSLCTTYTGPCVLHTLVLVYYIPIVFVYYIHWSLCTTFTGPCVLHTLVLVYYIPIVFVFSFICYCLVGPINSNIVSSHLNSVNSEKKD